MVSDTRAAANRRAEGFAMIEVLIAVAVLTVLGVGSFVGARGARGALEQGFDETRVTWLLTERLELARAAPEQLAPGVRSFELPDMPGASIVEVVERIEPRLLGVRVELHRGASPSPQRRMTTWIALEEDR